MTSPLMSLNETGSFQFLDNLLPIKPIQLTHNN